MDRHLSPAETARRFGVSIKALRLYEQHGFLKPLRTSNGSTGAAWRVYGPDQLARLHQILALKRLGLSLGQIGELLVGEDALDPILAFQERVLVKDSERISRALVLLRSARTKLASGAALSIDDLTALTQETVMTKYPTAKELKEAMTPFSQRHLTPQDDASLKEWHAGHSDLVSSGKVLMEEAAVLMASGDATTPAAMDFARRFRALTAQVNSSPSPVPAMAPRIKAALDEARSDPEASQKIEVFGFIQKALTNLQARESDVKDKG
ncbi:MerR family transcriptional regulator [Phenylobacterium sp.]|jgi:DNA-binding transcriptional MerR regulator|uniref:MerR family transcriptional regulator n=1 Tax=Phenylobacterium sp. TaxID=1871053 RepID=UPI002E37F1E5|nr:MerR family transcriptional regulator [Phenylobacterium sp.]HEX4711478.1 MerR family transcriptional regulator [Phenylobacterium sp.]